MYTSGDNRRDNVSVQKKRDLQNRNQMVLLLLSCSKFVFDSIIWQNFQCCRHILYTLRSISNYNASSLVKWYPLSDATHSARVQIPGDAFSSSVMSTYIIYTARDSKLQRLPLSQVVSAVGCHPFGPGSDPWGCIFKFSDVDIYYIHCARFQITTAPP